MSEPMNLAQIQELIKFVAKSGVSEVAGKIVKVLVDDAKPVEYDQPLFLVDPA